MIEQPMHLLAAILRDTAIIAACGMPDNDQIFHFCS
jgi:hypothetical protein